MVGMVPVIEFAIGSLTSIAEAYLFVAPVVWKPRERANIEFLVEHVEVS